MSQSIKVSPVLAVTDGIITTTSNAVAEFFGKLHKNVMQAIENLLADLPEKHRLNFQPMLSTIEIGGGATRQDPAYRLTRDGFTLLAMGFTGKKALAFKLAYIEAFNEMEAALHAPPALPHLITAAQAGELATLIAERFPDGKMRPYAWGRFNAHFRLASYRELPASRFDNACDYIRAMPHKEAAKALPMISTAGSSRRAMITFVRASIKTVVVNDGRLVEIEIPPHQLPFKAGQLATLYYAEKSAEPAYAPMHITAETIA